MTNSSNRATLLAVAAVAAVLIATLVVVQVLGGEQDPAADDQAGSAASFEPPPAGECVEPPAMPTSPLQFDEVPDAGLAEDAVWTATVTTNCGDIVMELDGTKAPQTVASFLHLAREGYWDASPCHRLVPSGIFVLQCGDPTGTGSGNPGYGFGVENDPDDDRYPRGSLAMARTTDPETNGGQFFVVYEDSEIPANGGAGYTIFGEVTEGMDIVDRVAESGVGGTIGPEAPVQPISLVDIEVEKAA